MEAKEIPFKIVSHMFIGRDEFGNRTYELTFNQSLVHTGRWKGIEDGLNAYREKEIIDNEQEILYEANKIIQKRKENYLGE